MNRICNEETSKCCSKLGGEFANIKGMKCVGNEGDWKILRSELPGGIQACPVIQMNLFSILDCINM